MALRRMPELQGDRTAGGGVMRRTVIGASGTRVDGSYQIAVEAEPEGESQLMIERTRGYEGDKYTRVLVRLRLTPAQRHALASALAREE